MTTDGTQQIEERLNNLEREVRALRAKLSGYEQNGLQSARFKNLSELFSAVGHTH